ncbi:MAG: hypothetical protein AB4352_29120 [Hormoscilla sp.]
MSFLLVNSFETNEVLRYDARTGEFIDLFVSAGSEGLDGPDGLTLGPDGNLYLATNGNDVRRYDGRTGAFLDVFASGGGLDDPDGIAFGPDGNLYVTSDGTEAVLRYDGTTGFLIDEFVSAGSGGLESPQGLTFGPDGHLYVSSEGTDQVLRYNGTTGAFLNVFTSGGGLDRPNRGLTFGPDGHLYVSSSGTDSVLRYDGTAGFFIDEFVSAGSGGLDDIRDINFGPDDNLYVTSNNTEEVLRYDGTTGAFLDVFATGGGLDSPNHLVFVDDLPPPPPPTLEMDFLLVSSFETDQVLRYDATTGFFIDEFVSAGSGGLNGPDGLTLGPDGNLYIATNRNDDVRRYDGRTGLLIDVFASGGGLDEPDGIAFGPDGNLYVTSDGTEAVLRYDGTTGLFIDEFVQAGSGGLNGPQDIIFGPDGHLYVSSFDTDQVLRYNGTTGAFLDVFASGGGLDGPNRGLTFGGDGNLYVSSSETNSVLRYDGTTGFFIDEFVSAGSGGLDSPLDINFGPDGHLYVISENSNEVLRYDGTTGAFLDVFAAGGGLDAPNNFVFVDGSPSTTLEQIVTPETLTVPTTPGTSVSFDVNYSTNPANSPTTGLRLRMHWDDSEISFTSITNTLSAGVQATGVPQPDIEDFDSDPDTDFFILTAWSDLGENWPAANPTLPERLFTANFVAQPDFSETTVNFTPTSAANEASFQSSSVEIVPLEVNLDIDGNGSTDALTDGLIALRYLFGFTGNTLIDGVIGAGATRNTADGITSYLDGARDTMLDVDGNGTADALTDGTSIARYLFGFRGDTLINGVIGPNAIRDTAPEIEAFLGAFDLPGASEAQGFDVQQMLGF